ncbi:hypothetical protein BEP19_02880 [Ammoniphilus oxalaticus]|uniref:HTH tetR-type domain-containing protein n=1 Tax=Ammoniphilus oxalaticus TaxID=66863 RepID=A0A419SNT2_9BACL|nr:TetR/AcrR family transcriptional regulator [Ammoniphilus oxalaticus]RKD25889.1 hypothetical protein BEP19_02880 [Ammoniphilus oxalaticus]
MSTKRIDKFQKIRDQRYEQLSQAALQLFSSKGFAATKISEITSSVNLSHGLFYHYFDSKEDAYVSIVLDVLDLFIRSVDDAASQSGSPRDQLVWLTKMSHEGATKKGLYRHVILLQAFDSKELSDEVKQTMSEKYKSAIDGISRIIANGQEQGLFIDGDPTELAIYFMSLSHGLNLWNARDILQVEISVDKVLRLIER